MLKTQLDLAIEIIELLQQAQKVGALYKVSEKDLETLHSLVSEAKRFYEKEENE